MSLTSKSPIEKISARPSSDDLTDEQFMSQALALGHRVRHRCAPNPWVGALVVRRGEIVGQGSTQAPGGRHAEIVALDEAADKARDSTVYVTLEPCVHEGRTGPCTEALISAGVTKVVVAILDPDPKMQGRGIAALRASGITVVTGVEKEEADFSLAPYVHHRLTGRSWCVLKVASSLDGRSVAANGESKWITGEASRADSHELRRESQAIVVGSGTALLDAPTLTVRTPGYVGEQPLRVLLDSRGRVRATGPLFTTTLAPTLVFTTKSAPSKVVDEWLAAGAQVETIESGPKGKGVNLETVLGSLGKRGIVQTMFEGGPEVAGALVQGGFVNRLVAYISGMILGTEAISSFSGVGVPALDQATRFKLISCVAMGDDARLDFISLGES